MPPIHGSWVNRKTVTGPVQGKSPSANNSNPPPTDWVGGGDTGRDTFPIFRSRTQFSTCPIRTCSPAPRSYGKRPTPLSISRRNPRPFNGGANRSDSWIPSSRHADLDVCRATPTAGATGPQFHEILCRCRTRSSVVRCQVARKSDQCDSNPLARKEWHVAHALWQEPEWISLASIYRYGIFVGNVGYSDLTRNRGVVVLPQSTLKSNILADPTLIQGMFNWEISLRRAIC